MHNSDYNNSDPMEVSFAEILLHYLKHWKLFLISVIVCLTCFIIYLQFAIPQYRVSSSVIIKDEKKGQGYDLTAFNDLGIITQKSNVDNEIEILSSKALMQQVIDSLHINVLYFKNTGLKKEELYKKSPIQVTVNEYKKKGSFIISKDTKKNKLHLKSNDDSEEDFERLINVGEMFESPWGWLTISFMTVENSEFPVIVKILSKDTYPMISVERKNLNASSVNIEAITSCPDKGIDIINTLIFVYNQQVINDKNYVANNTINFINERLADISGELQVAEKNVETYKQSRNLTDTKAEAGLYLTANSEYEKKISDADMQITILNYVRSYLKASENKDNIVPANIGLSDPTIINLINTYNDLILDKKRATSGMKQGNPLLQEYDDRANSLRSNLLKGIDIAESGLKLSRNELVKQETLYSRKIRGLSTQERESRELYRQKEIKETLFLYLLQKKEETGLTLALATPNARVIDKAFMDKNPVKPKKQILFIGAFLCGLIIPIIYIYIKGLFNFRLENKEELIKTVKAPYLGEIPISKGSTPLPTEKVRSGIAEKFRTITSNLKFLAGQDENKVIIITSTVSGEGKSFVSRNLALSLATSGKKTLLIDLDIRKSVMNETLDLTPSKGIVIYLSDPSIKVEDIIDKSGKIHGKLDIIPTKILPPNPAELLDSDRLDKLFKEVVPQYDYIIVDTPPIGLVADAFRISQFASACIYVTRKGYTHKKSLPDIQSLYQEKKLHNMSCILNGVSQSKYYGHNGDNYYEE